MAQIQVQNQMLEELKGVINEVGKTLDKINQLRKELKPEPRSIGWFMERAVDEILTLQKKDVCEFIKEVHDNVYITAAYDCAGWLDPELVAESISILSRDELNSLVDNINKGIDEQYKKFEQLKNVTINRINNNEKMHLPIVSYIYEQLCEIVHGVVEALAHINCVAHGCPCSVAMGNAVVCGRRGDEFTDEYIYCGDYPSLEEVECCSPFESCERLDELMEKILERKELGAEN